MTTTPPRWASSFVRTCLSAVLMLLAIAPTAATAAADATAATGTIEGRVVNPRNATTIENARVSVEGTSVVTFTDADGVFQIPNVPAGTARLRVFFTGLAPQTVDVVVRPNETVQREIALATAEGQVPSAEVVKLDAMVVDVSREMDAAAIAINEQRFAPNLRDVVSTDEFGAVNEGNVAEFLKFMPGVTVDLSGGDPRTISIDGAPPENTPITLAGLNLPVPGNNDTSRAVEVGFFNLNNVARIEVSHSPTPDMPGTALAGAVNMVPRSAFERTRPVFNGSAYVLMRDDLIDFHKRAAMYRDPRYVVHPGYDLSWVVPVNKWFGFSIAAGGSTQYSHQVGHTNVWRGLSAATNANAFPATLPGRPYLSAYTITDAPKESARDSFGATLDFKVTPHDRVALSFQYSSFDGWTAARSLQFNPTQIVAGTFTPTFSQGVAGAGNIVLTSGNGRVRTNTTYMPTFTWRHDGPIWKMESGVSRAYGTNVFRSLDKGLVLTAVARRNNVTISFDQSSDTRPGIITVIDNATKQPVDPFHIDSYSMTTVTDNPRRSEDINFTAYANVRRDFAWRVPITLKSGLDFRQSMRDLNAGSYSWAYRGSNTPGSAAPFIDPLISTREAPYGFGHIQFADYKGVFDYFKSHPAEFTLDENALYRAQVNNSKRAKESVSAAYLRADVALLERRLLLVGGVRVEQTNIHAQGPLTDPTRNVQRDANGRPRLDAAGRPIPITTDALQTSILTLLPRATQVEKEYFRYFPSLNASYNLRENLIARAAVSTSIGPPDFNQYTGAVTLPNTDNLPSSGNRIVVNNAGIKPWTANSMKLRLEYYFAGVGQFAVGVFRRDYKNFFGNTVFLPTPEFLTLYGLDPTEFGAYEVSTQYNIPGRVRTQGYDFNYKQALTFLPRWARGVQVFANFSVRKTDTPDLGSLGFNDIPRSGAFGISLTRPRFNVRVNSSYRALQKKGFITGASIEPGTFNYTPARNTIDVLGEYTIWRRIAVFMNLRNVTDIPNEDAYSGPSTPSHAKLRMRERYGSLWMAGVKGTF